MHNYIYINNHIHIYLYVICNIICYEGIVHHMVIVKDVLDDLMMTSEQIHGIEFWKVLLNQR